MEVDPKKMDKALHDIPVFLKEVTEVKKEAQRVVANADKLFNQLAKFRQELLKSIEDN